MRRDNRARTWPRGCPALRHLLVEGPAVMAAAHALEDLTKVSQALARGLLGLDKVVELTRVATRPPRPPDHLGATSPPEPSAPGGPGAGRPIQEVRRWRTPVSGTGGTRMRAAVRCGRTSRGPGGPGGPGPGPAGPRASRDAGRGAGAPLHARARRADALVALAPRKSAHRMPTGPPWSSTGPLTERLLSGTGGCEIEAAR